MPLARVDERACIERVMQALAARRGGWIVTANLDILRRYVFDAAFRALVRPASMFVADGMPLVWASALQGVPLPQRVTGADLIHNLSARAAHHGYSVFLLGGDDGTAEQAASRLRAQCPQLKVAGTWYPPPGFERDPAHLTALRQVLQGAQPDIVYVALGCPRQDRLIAGLRTDFPRTWWIGVGISFSLLAGRLRRAPRWAQRAGLEWACRLWQEPRRLAVRYLVHGLPFALLLLLAAMLARLLPRKPQGLP
ncbi:WecB/TagA/CpsF family glycosyltransferase [Duganella sp. FT80W]|uniref:WecB/TagA/CpsF family glycosyltransferase n=2 Tax=Duganella guangzhouensis TaxID=2666084 RepID=A0A6I2L149_9BURK|nr:WecB/TagA/CpsF family glycosyltransferase [Duganella guangzhouensis]